jgi:hypothetical protein
LPPPGTPVITEPANGFAIAPGATIDLSAQAEDPAGLDVKYRWKYSKDGGADQTIGDSSVVDSGTEATYAWDTSALTAGTYVLKCWSVNTNDDASVGYAEVTLYLAHVLITAPAALSSHVAGAPLILSGSGYLLAAGEVAIRWEVDTNTPPDSASADYQTIDSAYGAQGASLSVGVTLGLGTWYVRALALDTADPPVASDWTAALTFYVLEQIRLLAGSTIQQSILSSRNKIWARVKGTDIVATATYDVAGDPMAYSVNRREDQVILPDGDLTAAQAVATATVTRRHVEQEAYSGLEVSLEDGMKLQRGQLVGVQIDRLGVSGTFPIRELVFDIAAGKCSVVVGDWQAPKTEADVQVEMAQRVDRLERERA